MDQSETVEFLAGGTAFASAGEVKKVETHGAYVFLRGDEALKLKRSVRYDYMDLSTPEKRHVLLLRELDLNRPAAPEIYRDVVAVRRGPDGALHLGETGEVVDWILRMWRFPAENELEAVVARGDFDDRLALATGTEIAGYHARSERRSARGSTLIADILDEFDRVFADFTGARGAEQITKVLPAARQAWADVAPLLDLRAEAGHVRRVHGDLHLRNLVLIKGRPVPFDALEFDEVLGTCDVLYDIAYLIMDLLQRKEPRAACRVLDGWLRASGGAEDSGLSALPLFIAIRATIRAMVALQGDAARDQPGASAEAIASYLDLASDALKPRAPRLVAVGGFSGSGKSVLASGLAPGLGALPGAIWMSSDIERKSGKEMTAHLPAEAYTEANRRAVYDRLFDRTATLLTAGQSVVLDASFLNPALRQRAAALAETCNVPFTGLWLQVPPAILRARVAARHGDASDAGPEVLEKQLASAGDAPEWVHVDGDQSPDATLAEARHRLTS